MVRIAATTHYKTPFRFVARETERGFTFGYAWLI